MVVVAAVKGFVHGISCRDRIGSCSNSSSRSTGSSRSSSSSESSWE